MRVISFSVCPKNTKATQLVSDIKSYAYRRGLSFSFLVLQALEYYKKEVLDK